MRETDLEGAERLTSASYYDLDRRMIPRSHPDPSPRSPENAAGWILRTGHTLSTDPGGCWVAEDGSRLVGIATSSVRESTWILGSFAVSPELQGQGVGKQLLAAAASHGRGCLRGMLSASSDPKAVRRYRLAGFDLHPQMFLTGVVDRSVLPVVDKMREGSDGDLELMNSVDRHTRDAAHGPDHQLLMRNCRLVVTDSSTGSGYVYVGSGGHPALLAATNRRTATRLLWECLAATSPTETATISHVTAANAWAIDVGMEARMELHTSGYLALRRMKPPAPYLHNGVFL